MIKKGFAIFFFVATLLPSVLFIGIGPDVNQRENRAFSMENETYSPLSFSNIKKYLSHSKANFKDHFFGRSYFIEKYCDLNISFFNTSPNPQKIITGEYPWLFGGNGLNNVVAHHLGLMKQDTSKVWNIENILDSLKKQNINSYFLLAPDKHSIYPEKLNPLLKDSKHINHVFLPNKSNIINPTYKLIEVKQNQQVYRYTNTHWNDLGGFWAMKLLNEKLIEDGISLNELNLNQYEIKTTTENHETLSNSLFFDKYYLDLDKIILRPYEDLFYQKIDSKLKVPPNFKRKQEDYEARFISNANTIKILIFRDSFFENLPPFIAPFFGETVLIWDEFSWEVVNKEKPDIVLLQKAERFLY